MVVVQEFRQLLPQAFVAFAFVAENDCPFKEGFLQFLREVAPEIERRGAKNQKVAVIVRRHVRCCAHRQLLAQWPPTGGCSRSIAAEAERISKIGVPLPNAVPTSMTERQHCGPRELRQDSHDCGMLVTVGWP
jgi:hypothetical protein